MTFASRSGRSREFAAHVLFHEPPVLFVERVERAFRVRPVRIDLERLVQAVGKPPEQLEAVPAQIKGDIGQRPFLSLADALVVVRIRHHPVRRALEDHQPRRRRARCSGRPDGRRRRCRSSRRAFRASRNSCPTARCGRRDRRRNSAPLCQAVSAGSARRPRTPARAPKASCRAPSAPCAVMRQLALASS